MRILGCTIIALILLANLAYSQEAVNYNFFSNDPIGRTHVSIPAPLLFRQTILPSFAAVTPQQMQSTNGLPGMNTPVRPDPDNLINANTAQAIQLRSDLERELQLDQLYKQALEKERATQSYKEAFDRLTRMNPNNFSLSQAVYEVENAYLDGQLSREWFQESLQKRVDHVHQILKSQGLSSKNDLSVNYAIQQLFEHPNPYYDAKNHLTHNVPPLKYDFEDYMGEKDYTKLFASKLLATGSGQCHSLPLFYLMIAEQLGAKAWLSLAPEHSFVQFMDSRGRLMDYETTNGNIVSGSWMAGSGYINAKALRNRTYLDTLSRRQLYARCLSDLLLGYLNKFEYDGFAQDIGDAIQRIDSTNITALIVDANLKRSIAMQAIKDAGMPRPEELHKYPQAWQCYQQMKEAVDRVNNLGYQEMPSDVYQTWLRSIETEKKRLETEKLQERVNLEAKMQKSSLQNKKHNPD